MKVLFWPQLDEKEICEVSIEDFLSKLKINHPALWALIRKTIELAQKPRGIDALRKSQYVGILRGLQDPIWEFRIPPIKRKGGVVRIYFCIIKKGHSDCIICLDAEFKKRKKSSKQKIQSAQRRYKEIPK